MPTTAVSKRFLLLSLLLIAACTAPQMPQTARNSSGMLSQANPQAQELTNAYPALARLLAAQVTAGLSPGEAQLRVAARAGVRPEELMHPTQAQDISKDLLQRLDADTQALLGAAQAAGQAPGTALPLIAPPGSLYAWTQFSDDGQAPFSRAVLSAVGRFAKDGSALAMGSLNDELPMSGPAAKVSNASPDDLAARYEMSAPGLGVGRQVARAITTASHCPEMQVDGQAVAMKVRAPRVRGIASNSAAQMGRGQPPIKADFEVLTCEAPLPPAARIVAINGQRQAVLDPAALIQRVVVVGDTGCRVQGPEAFGPAGSTGAPLQDCSDESDWPWRKIARAAASFNPDLIIHNGDIHYREGTPKGLEPGQSQPNEVRYAAYLDTITYGWKAWQADFFKPAGPLLSAAPWVITRGNHELCDRAGAGWYRFLDYRSFPAAEPQYSTRYDANTCSNYTDPLLVRLGDLQLILMDAAGLADSAGRGRNQGWSNGDHVRTARQLNAVAEAPSTRSAAISWLVTHKPLFAYYAGGPQVTSSTWQFQKALQAGEESFAAGNGHLPANLQMVHSGHIHGWQMISHPAAADLPTQFLIGMSGQTLEGLVFSSRGARPYAMAVPKHQATDISPDDKRWPWHEAPWAFQQSDGRSARPDAFSTSPIAQAGSDKAHATEFGFVVFDRLPGTSNWTARMFDPERRLLRTCTTEGKRTRCQE
ncbi:metallophosphoesterase [Roseateles koreensis]|uniref:Metallophosphoesterase n=1 Tax=Roseateles koreensis TaxID=2987526 RepID=A0ABT5KWH3_9BURK|nr:metallophosphoesterase [Roseateles koreensis]MDC8787141.1 metallophosphoesterase [Roseateles koreensis]